MSSRHRARQAVRAHPSPRACVYSQPARPLAAARCANTLSTIRGNYSGYDLVVDVEAAPNVASSMVTEVAPDAGIPDEEDNCTLAVNPPQRDTDADGIGKMCDPDIAPPNDCVVNIQDLGFILLALFSMPFTSDWKPDADLKGVNVIDLGIMKRLFFGPLGPSGVPNACERRISYHVLRGRRALPAVRCRAAADGHLIFTQNQSKSTTRGKALRNDNNNKAGLIKQTVKLGARHEHSTDRSVPISWFFCLSGQFRRSEQ